MSTLSNAEVDAATRLLKFARGLTQTGELDHVSSVAGRLLSVLFQTLSPVIGVAGVAAIFGRSITLSGRSCPHRGAFHTHAGSPRLTEPDASRWLVERLEKLPPADALEAAIHLFATFFRVLSNLIGEQLLWQIVMVGFPKRAEIEPEETE